MMYYGVKVFCQFPVLSQPCFIQNDILEKIVQKEHFDCISQKRLKL